MRDDESCIKVMAIGVKKEMTLNSRVGEGEAKEDPKASGLGCWCPVPCSPWLLCDDVGPPL